MSYRIAQDFEYSRKDYWNWRAWIEADDAELDKVKEVVWILHPSFTPSRVVIKQRANKFRLETAGWGTFLLRAEVMLAGGEKRLLKHNLRLEYPADLETSRPRRSTASPPASRPMTVYLSYSTQDSRVAAKLRGGLQSAGFEVLDQTQVGPGEPWSEALRRMITQSDTVVGLIGEDEISPWVSAELKAAAASSKPALVLLATDSSGVKLPGDVRTLAIDANRPDVMAIAELLRSG
jgi:TIR domain/YEATS family